MTQSTPTKAVTITLYDAEANQCDSLTTTDNAVARDFVADFFEAHAFDPEADGEEVPRTQMAGSVTWRIGDA